VRRVAPTAGPRAPSCIVALGVTGTPASKRSDHHGPSRQLSNKPLDNSPTVRWRIEDGAGRAVLSLCNEPLHKSRIVGRIAPRQSKLPTSQSCSRHGNADEQAVQRPLMTLRQFTPGPLVNSRECSERSIKAADRRITELLGRVIDAPGDIPAEVLEEPPSTGDVRYDTLLATGLAYALARCGIPALPWTTAVPALKTSDCGAATPTPRRSSAHTSGGGRRRCSRQGPAATRPRHPHPVSDGLGLGPEC
jgi:hypothetical protein